MYWGLKESQFRSEVKQGYTMQEEQKVGSQTMQGPGGHVEGLSLS